jgi:hypothetical protein
VRPFRRSAQQRADHARQVQPADRSNAPASGCARGTCEEACRSGSCAPQIGRILKQNQRAAARFAITLEHDYGCPVGFRLGVVYSDAFDNWAAISEGAYLLSSNTDDWNDHSTGRPISS